MSLRARARAYLLCASGRRIAGIVRGRTRSSRCAPLATALTAQSMASLPSEVLETVLRLAYEFRWDEVDIERELERRHFLRDAALVCRRFAPAATLVLGETLVVRRLGDFEAIEDAVERGTLRLAGVRTLVLDESVCRVEDPDRLARRRAEAEGGGSVDLTPDVLDKYVFDDDEFETLEDFTQRGRALASSLPRLRELRSTRGRTLSRQPWPWPVARLAIEMTCDEEDFWRSEWPDIELWEVLGGWSELRDLSVIRVTSEDPGVGALPDALCGRLRSLRLGVGDGSEDAWQRSQFGIFLEGRIFAHTTPRLRQLDIRLACSLVGYSEPWTESLFGCDSDNAFVPSLEQLTIGWPAREFDTNDVLPLIEVLPGTLHELAIVIGQSPPWSVSNPFSGFDLLATLACALLNRQHAVGLVRLNLDMAGFGLNEETWRSHLHWLALEATCAERGVQLALVKVD